MVEVKNAKHFFVVQFLSFVFKVFALHVCSSMSICQLRELTDNIHRDQDDGTA